MPFLFSCYGDHRDLHSFPTRRSSDLVADEDGPLAELGRSVVDRVDLEAVHPVGVMQIADEGPDNRTGLLILDRKSTRLNSSHTVISYAVFCLKKKKKRRS